MKSYSGSPSDQAKPSQPLTIFFPYSRHFPGEMLSVKPSTASGVPGLFHLNERVAWIGEWQHGFFSMTAVAATNVGDIREENDEHPEMKTNQAWGLKKNCTFLQTCAQAGKRSLYFSEYQYEKPKQCSKGDPFGYFNFGSTIVLIFEAPKKFNISSNGDRHRINVGQSLLPEQAKTLGFGQLGD